jgi:thiamine biosynthesis lipoprotein
VAFATNGPLPINTQIRDKPKDSRKCLILLGTHRWHGSRYLPLQLQRGGAVSSYKPAEASPSSAPSAEGSQPRNTRRRLLVLGAMAGLPLAGWQLQRATTPQPLRWQGTAMGAPASLVLHHDNPARAQAALAATVAELERLEALFSLFRADSWLSRLNQAGRVAAAPPEFTTLLRASLAMAAQTQGVFDPTVQPLWQLYFDHFVVAGAPQAPTPAAVAQALARVDWRGVHIEGDAVSLARAGMALTLNGVAQGFITDRCTDVLRVHGFDRMLVDMGEPRALAAKPDGTAWRIGLADPREPSRALRTLPVIDRAVATSGGYGTRLDDAGRFTHLINARNGMTAPAFESVTVIAPTALQADALSTALALMPAFDVATRQALLNRHPGCWAVCIDAQGQMLDLEASA